MLTTGNNFSSMKKCTSAVWIYFINNKAKPSIGYGKHLLATTLIYPSLYKQIWKKNKTTSRLQWTNALIITICLILSGDIHPCPGPHRVTPEERPLEERDTTVLQVCPLYDALQCSPVRSNLSCPSSSVGTLGSRAGAVTELVDWRVRCAWVSRASVGVGGVPGAHGVGVGGVRRVLGGSRGASLQSDGFAGTSGGSCVSSGPGVHAGLARPRGSVTTLKACALRVPIVMQNVNRKQLNPGIAKNKKWEVFQTVNHSRTVWDPKAKPKGLLGGHLNIRNIRSKSEQIQHLLLDSNLDFLCLSETWLNQNAPLAALNIPGYNIYRKDREGSKKGGGVMVYIKSTLQCLKMQWSNCNLLECLGLNVSLSPQMSFVLVVICRPPSADNSFYENFEKLLKESNLGKEIIIMGDFNINWEDKTSTGRTNTLEKSSNKSQTGLS